MGEASEESAQEVIEGTVALQLTDFTRAWRFLPQIKSSIFLLVMMGVFLPVAIGIKLWSPGSGGAQHIAVMLIVFGALAFGLWRGRERFARTALEAVRGGQGVFYRFDDVGFTVNAPGRESRVAWSELYRCIDTVPAFLIYTGPLAVVIVPKRAFPPADVARLQAMLVERIRPRELGGIVRKRRLLITWLVLVVAFLVIWQLLSQK